MKLTEHVEIVETQTIGAGEAIDMGIPDEMIAQAIDMAINYSDIIGSVVREITTNAFCKLDRAT